MSIKFVGRCGVSTPNPLTVRFSVSTMTMMSNDNGGDPREDTTVETPTNTYRSTADPAVAVASSKPTSRTSCHPNYTGNSNSSSNSSSKRSRQPMSEDGDVNSNNSNNNNNINHGNNHGRKNDGGRDQKRGRGRNHNRGNNNNNNNNANGNRLRRMSHALSWALRHSAQDIGLPIREDGYVPVHEIIQCDHPKLKKVFGQGRTTTAGGGGGGKGGGNKNVNTDIDIDESSDYNHIINDIRSVVETNDKQRFKLSYRPKALYYETDGDGDEQMILCIRANQGHSMDCINFEKLLTKLSSEQILELPCIVHGTYFDKWTDHIQQEGLNRMTRNHVHFATGVPQRHDEQQQKEIHRNHGSIGGDAGGDSDVVSGIRKSCTVHIYLDLKKCAAAAAAAIATDPQDVGPQNNKGVKIERIDFYMSENGVVLTDGVSGTGVVPPEYFADVVDARTGKKLLG